MSAELTKYVVITPSLSEAVQDQREDFLNLDDAIARAIERGVDPSTIEVVTEDIPEDGI